MLKKITVVSFVTLLAILTGCGGLFDDSWDSRYSYNYNYGSYRYSDYHSDTQQSVNRRYVYLFDAKSSGETELVGLLNLAFNLTAINSTATAPVAVLNSDKTQVIVDASSIGFGDREADILNHFNEREILDINEFLNRMFSAQVYYQLTQTPDSKAAFERQLGLPSATPRRGLFRLGELMLLIEDSGVSQAPREIRVERISGGRLYTSLDRDIDKFNEDERRNTSSRNPIKKPFDALHDGEEIIRVMPNGLLHFSLWDSNTGKRIDEAPKPIAFDRTGMSRRGRGSLIANPTSCLDCHGKYGLMASDWAGKDLPDVAAGINTSERNLLRRFYKGTSFYEELAKVDNQRVEAALAQAKATKMKNLPRFLRK